jgi:hypothetical protein
MGDQNASDFESLLPPIHDIEQNIPSSCNQWWEDTRDYASPKLRAFVYSTDNSKVAAFVHLVILLAFAISFMIEIWFVITVAVIAGIFYTMRIVRAFRTERAIFFGFVESSEVLTFLILVIACVILLVIGIIGVCITGGQSQNGFIVLLVYSSVGGCVSSFALFVKRANSLRRSLPDVHATNVTKLRGLLPVLDRDCGAYWIGFDYGYGDALVEFLTGRIWAGITDITGGKATLRGLVKNHYELKDANNTVVYKGDIRILREIRKVYLMFSPAIGHRDFRAALECYVNAQDRAIPVTEIEPVV